MEAAAGFYSRSLAVLADAAHMAADAAAMGFALCAFWMADKPPTQRMSYGFHRAEILAALANGVVLVNMVIFIFLEAIERFRRPPAVQYDVMLLFAMLGILLNLACAFTLREQSRANLNLRGVFFHIAGDLLASVGVLGAALAAKFFGWKLADPAASLLIGCMILYFAWNILAEAASILLEAVPGHINLAALEKTLLEVRGVRDIHDLHVWSITSGKESLSAHLEVAPGVNPDEILNRVSEILSKEFQVDHTTLQIETIPRTKRESQHFHL
jgi:cobalt-zinc-cadmium efflux system protein